MNAEFNSYDYGHIDESTGKNVIDQSLPVIISTERFKSLLKIQTYPDKRIWFKEQEITLDEFVTILTNTL